MADKMITGVPVSMDPLFLAVGDAFNKITPAPGSLVAVQNMLKSMGSTDVPNLTPAQVGALMGDQYYSGSSAPSTEQGGSGLGTVNPPSVVPSDPATEQATVDNGILGAAFPEIFRKTALKPTYLNADNTMSNDQTSPLKQGDGRKETYFADTTFGAERVNARTSEHGVTAVKKDGKVYMTNINPDGSVNKGTGSPNSVLGNGMGSQQNAPMLSRVDLSATITTAMDKLSKTSDYAVARALFSNLNATIAGSRATMEAEAIKFAEGKYRVPELEAMLEQSVRTDMASVGWYPGIGDSPVTSKLRAELNAARSSSAAYSKNYLASNTSYAALGAVEANMRIEYDRIKNVVLKRDQIEMRADESQAEWDRRRQVIAQEKKMAAQDEVDMLSPEQLKRVVLLNPALGMPESSTGKPDPVSIAKFVKNKQVAEAVTAIGDQLPVIALEGNQYARVLLARQEAGTYSEKQVEEKLDSLRKTANSATFAKTYATWKHGSNKEALNAELVALQSGAAATDPAMKKNAGSLRLMAALEMERAAQTEYVLNDITTLLPRDGMFKDAIEQSIKVTNNASIENVINALTRATKSDEERRQVLAVFNKAVLDAAEKRKESVFGRPDVNKLKQAMVESSMQWANSSLVSVLSAIR